jgi:hypothetical protein
MKDQTTTDIREADKTLEWNSRTVRDLRVQACAPQNRISQLHCKPMSVT